MSPSFPPAGVPTAMASISPVRTQPALAVEVFMSAAIVGRAAVTRVIREPKPRTDSAITHSSNQRYSELVRESCASHSRGSTRQMFGSVAEGVWLTYSKYVGFRKFFYIILDF